MNNVAEEPMQTEIGMDTSGLTTSPDAFKHVTALLRHGVEDGVFPGCTIAVGRFGNLLYREAVGNRAPGTEDEPAHPVTADTVFDVAGLTQPVVTGTLMMLLAESGKLDPTDRVSRYLQGFGVYNKARVTVEQVLSHSSGLAAWHPYFEELIRQNSGSRMGILTSRGAKDYIINSIVRAHLKYTPGSRQVYSDIGFMLLGNLIEVLTGLTLDRATHKYLCKPLGMRSSSFIDLGLVRRRGILPVKDMIAPTEECGWRKRLLCGEVHDDNAWAMGGIAGHSGLFSTVDDLHRFSSEMVRASMGQSSYLEPATVRRFWAGNSDFAEDEYKYAWSTPARDNGMLDCGFSSSAVGMNGFTGCSMWIDPDRGLDIVFLSNRVCPSRANKKIQAFRTQLFTEVLKTVDSSC